MTNTTKPSDFEYCDKCGTMLLLGVCRRCDPTPAKPKNVSTIRTPKKNSVNNIHAVIITVTKAHDIDDIYNRLIGVPDNATNQTNISKIVPGTRIYINYPKIGISKVVKSVGIPYIDTSIIKEWGDKIERYAIRVDTEHIKDMDVPITVHNVHDMGIKHANTGNVLRIQYGQSSITPISSDDADKLDAFTGKGYWDTISPDARFLHLREIADWITDAIGNDGILYLDTTSDDTPDAWYYSDTLSDLIIEARDIMRSLGIEKLQSPQ